MIAFILLWFLTPTEVHARETEKGNQTSVFEKLLSHPQIGFLENCLYLDDENVDRDIQQTESRKSLFANLVTPLASTFDPFTEDARTLCTRLFEGLPNASCGVTADRMLRLVQPGLQEKRAAFRGQLGDTKENDIVAQGEAQGPAFSSGADGLIDVLSRFQKARESEVGAVALMDFGPHTFLLESKPGAPGSVYLHQTYDGFFSLTIWAHKGRSERKVDSLFPEMLRILDRYQDVHSGCQNKPAHPDVEIYSAIEKLFVHPVVKILPQARKSCGLLEKNRVYFGMVEFKRDAAQARVDQMISRCSRLKESVIQNPREAADAIVSNVGAIWGDFPGRQKLTQEVTACLKYGRGA